MSIVMDNLADVIPPIVDIDDTAKALDLVEEDMRRLARAQLQLTVGMPQLLVPESR